MVRILIAEAHEFFRLGLIAICERHPGWEVVADTADSERAIQLAEALRPDVSVIDLSVFEPNGLKAIDHLRLTVPKTRVLVCSDCPVRPVMEKVRRAGASAFLAKSESPARFVAAMEGVLAGEPFLASASAFRDYPRLNPAERVPVHYLLSEREIAVLRLLARDYSNREIAQALGLSVRTAESHLSAIYQRLSVRSRGALLRLAIRDGLV
jgi:NarL family two-component system response regulator LiaR